MRKVLIAAISIVPIAACSKKEDIDILPDKDKIYATIQNFEDGGTKVQLNDKIETVWSSGDTIRTFLPGKISNYVFDGKSGDRAGSFTWVNDLGIYERADSVAYVDPMIKFLLHGITELRT